MNPKLNEFLGKLKLKANVKKKNEFAKLAD